MKKKWFYFRHKLFHYRHVERKLASQPHVKRMLDIGCGVGENLQRFSELVEIGIGVDISASRLKKARQFRLDVARARGTKLPFPDQAFDLLYIAHVLHHVADHKAVLAEANRCLAPGGSVIVVETVTDNLLLRLGRAIHPYWRGDKVMAEWRFEELVEILGQAGFDIKECERYGVLFFLWEWFPNAVGILEIFTPIFVYLDLFLARLLKEYSVHCFFVLERKM